MTKSERNAILEDIIKSKSSVMAATRKLDRAKNELDMLVATALENRVAEQPTLVNIDDTNFSVTITGKDGLVIRRMM